MNNQQSKGHAVPISELNLPPILYKYRDFQNDFHKQSLLDSEIYIPSAKDFNDPYDSNIPFRYKEEDLTKENLYLKALEISRREFQKLTEQQHQIKVFENEKKGLIFDEHHIDQFDKMNFEQNCNNFGLFCVTPNPSNFLMWSYYANSHKGFCVGYHSDKLLSTLLFSMGGVVDYRDEFPKMPLFPTKTDSLFLNTFYIKWKIWKHEDEYRLLHQYKNGKKFNLPPEVVAEVILGCQFPEPEKQQFINKLITKYTNVVISEIKLNFKDTFELSKQTVYDPKLSIENLLNRND